MNTDRAACVIVSICAGVLLLLAACLGALAVARFVLALAVI